MTRSGSFTFDSALALLCNDDWAPSGTHVPTPASADILRALLRPSRTDDGRSSLGSSNAISALVSVLRDPLSHSEPLGERAVRLLRNLCVRSSSNQDRVRETGAPNLVLNALSTSLDAPDASARLRQPFVGFAVEFLVNFVTGNPTNAKLVWRQAFARVLDALLRCPNPAAAAAAGALVHNCVVATPVCMPDLTKIWRNPGSEVDTTLMHTLVHIMYTENDTGEDSIDNDGMERFSWSFNITRRIIRAGRLATAFDALGPALDAATSEPFSADQLTLLHIVDAGASRCAEVPPTSDLEVLSVPPESLSFFGDVLDAALLRRAGAALHVAVSIVGSIVIVNDNSSELDALRLRAVKVAVNVLRALHATDEMDSGGTMDKVAAGLRAMLIRAVAICVDKCRAAQDAVRELQGLPLVLSALSYESDVTTNPFLREWAVLAVRNLTADNRENADEIAQFELVGVQSDAEFLQKTGLEAFMDPKTGRPRLRQKQNGVQRDE